MVAFIFRTPDMKFVVPENIYTPAPTFFGRMFGFHPPPLSKFQFSFQYFPCEMWLLEPALLEISNELTRNGYGISNASNQIMN